MTTSFISDAATTNTALPLAKVDALFDGVDAGLWGFDTASKFGYLRAEEPVYSVLMAPVSKGVWRYQGWLVDHWSILRPKLAPFVRAPLNLAPAQQWSEPPDFFLEP